MTQPGGGWIDSLTAKSHSGVVEAKTIEEREAKETSDRTALGTEASIAKGVVPCLEANEMVDLTNSYTDR